MIKEYIKTLEDLRPEETRFDFDPLNKNLCFCAPGGGGGGSNNPLENILDAPANVRDNLLSGLSGLIPGGGGGDGGGGTTESGGLSEEDKEIKKLIYGELKEMFDKEHVPYTGDMYANRSLGELDLLKKLKGGGGYQNLHSAASKSLGFGEDGVTPGSAADVYKEGLGYGTDELGVDTSALMGAGSTYRDKVADTTMRQMTEAASRTGMINRGHQIGGGAAWGDRSMLEDAFNKQGYLAATGDQLGKMNLGAYDRARSDAFSLKRGREGSAGLYSDAVMRNLGLGIGGLDKHYSTSLGAYGSDRGYLDRDLKQDRKEFDLKENFPFKKLAYASGLYSGMPFEDKVVNQQPGSSGK